MGNVQKSANPRDRKWTSGAGGWGRTAVASRVGVSFWGDENVLEPDSGDGGTPLERMPWNHVLCGQSVWCGTVISVRLSHWRGTAEAARGAGLTRAPRCPRLPASRLYGSEVAETRTPCSGLRSGALDLPGSTRGQQP